ncbi:hypothetical protein IV38_GL001282 [Lactobacillus selangorensis]|uniref:HTH marR-type domain-containing protein n=1 Tax=Lactobacillus selangorensis TaxID=81857 RepID=A0A0R2FUZ5_9LACO|nr:winged helix DNA-binding protein [Lactobacillus selangorensis]KRN29066.1 hypothetical protein IV38_GL001282 [Lactobacillus selangorensis]KRN30021.1 hypothetical protein IV40_GL002050 [Lactobacillus selangorensis]
MDMNTEFPIGAAVIGLVASHRAMITKQIRAFDLYPGQDMMLMQLLGQPNQSQNDLRKALHVDHSTIAKSIGRLAKREIVTTTKSTQDKRITLVSLTPRGIDLAKQVVAIWHAAEETALNRLTESQKDDFLNDAKQITTNFDQKNA